jgi:hypothetical protein
MYIRKIETTNERICKFYENNPNIHFESVNLIFIDLFDELLKDLNSTMNISINSQILSNIHENTQKINELNSSVILLKDMMLSTTEQMTTRYTNIKKDYIEEINKIVQYNTFEKMGPLLDKNNNLLIDKTQLLMHEIIPKSQNHLFQDIQHTIQQFHKSIAEDTKMLLKHTDNQSIKEYINNFEMKSSIMLQNLHQPIYTFISASEDRINNNIIHLKDNCTNNQNIQQKLMNDISQLIQQQNSSNSICFQQKQIQTVLTKIYSTAEIVSLNHSTMLFSRSITNNGNNNNLFILKRPNKTNILIESIHTERNINNDEIKQFIQTMEENNSHGIFLSQNSGFSSKPNYHIETYNKLIIIFVHNVNYEEDKIKTAVDVIDNLYLKLREFNHENIHEITIDKHILEEINKEYQYFIQQKELLTNLLKESQKKIYNQIEEFKFPSLDKYLSTKFSIPIQKQGFKCDLCKLFNANNLKALAAHKRGCYRKNIIITPIK